MLRVWCAAPYSERLPFRAGVTQLILTMSDGGRQCPSLRAAECAVPRRSGSLTMSSSPDSADVIPPEQRREDTREIVYLVKRPSYTLAIAVPLPSPSRLSWEQAVVQAQLKRRGPIGSYVLNPSELETLYEDLQGLVAYLRERRGRPSADFTRAP
jgi:hypothetical protein